MLRLEEGGFIKEGTAACNPSRDLLDLHVSDPCDEPQSPKQCSNVLSPPFSLLSSLSYSLYLILYCSLSGSYLLVVLWSVRMPRKKLSALMLEELSQVLGTGWWGEASSNWGHLVAAGQFVPRESTAKVPQLLRF